MRGGVAPCEKERRGVADEAEEVGCWRGCLTFEAGLGYGEKRTCAAEGRGGEIPISCCASSVADALSFASSV